MQTFARLRSIEDIFFLFFIVAPTITPLTFGTNIFYSMSIRLMIEETTPNMAEVSGIAVNGCPRKS